MVLWEYLPPYLFACFKQCLLLPEIWQVGEIDLTPSCRHSPIFASSVWDCQCVPPNLESFFFSMWVLWTELRSCTDEVYLMARLIISDPCLFNSLIQLIVGQATADRGKTEKFQTFECSTEAMTRSLFQISNASMLI